MSITATAALNGDGCLLFTDMAAMVRPVGVGRLRAMVVVVPTGAISQTGAGRSEAPTGDGSYVCDADPEDIGKHTIFWVFL